jgi:membrane protease YdiL (CAAX protease family)
VVVSVIVGISDKGNGYEGSFYLALIGFILLLAWQFFSGIYIGVEHKMKHRSLFQIGYFCLGIIGLLFTVMGMPMGLAIVFSFTPVFMLVYFLVACFDLRRTIVKEKTKAFGDDQVLDSGDIFN